MLPVIQLFDYPYGEESILWEGRCPFSEVPLELPNEGDPHILHARIIYLDKPVVFRAWVAGVGIVSRDTGDIVRKVLSRIEVGE